MSFITWVEGIFQSAKKVWAKSAVSILIGIDDNLQNGGILAGIINVVSPKFGPAVVAILNAEIPKLIAVGLGLEGLPANATPAQVLAWENTVVTAFTSLTNASKFKTTLVAQIYGIIQQQLSTNPNPTFAQDVIDVEAAWKDYEADLAAEAAGTLAAVPLTPAPAVAPIPAPVVVTPAPASIPVPTGNLSGAATGSPAQNAVANASPSAAASTKTLSE